jgi:hypothetical protein
MKENKIKYLSFFQMLLHQNYVTYLVEEAGSGEGVSVGHEV